MGLRALLVVVAVYGTLPVILARPFFGILVFTWLSTMRPQDFTWGLDARLSLWVGLATVVGLLFKLREERLVSLRPQVILLVALWVWFAFAASSSYLPEVSLSWLGVFSKIVLFNLLMTGMVRTPERLRLLLLVTAFSLGLVGLKYGLYGLLRGGVELATGPAESDRNDLALLMAMAVPLLAGFSMGEENLKLKRIARFLAAFCALTVCFTFSRGGFLTLAGVGGLLLVRTRKWVLALVLALLAVGLFSLADEGFRGGLLGRAKSIETYQQDASAVGRLVAWKVALRMSADYPVLGVGPMLFVDLAPTYGGLSWRVAHNTYLQILAECGIPALVLYLALLFLTLWRLERLTRSGGPPWVRAYALGIQISLLGFLAGAIFLNRAYMELVYQLVALSVCLDIAAETAVAAAVPTEARGERPEAGIDWWRQAPAPSRGPGSSVESR